MSTTRLFAFLSGYWVSVVHEVQCCSYDFHPFDVLILHSCLGAFGKSKLCSEYFAHSEVTSVVNNHNCGGEGSEKDSWF